jgi:hypothetical protein
MLAGSPAFSQTENFLMLDDPDNKVAAVLQGMMEKVDDAHDEDKLLALIENSIIARYSGELEKHEADDGAVTFTPLDTDDIRDLLTTLWGGHITPQALELVFETLVTDGAEAWPQAYCEEVDDAERERRLASLDHEIEYAEEHVKKLKDERDRLVGEGFDQWYAQERHRLMD